MKLKPAILALLLALAGQAAGPAPEFTAGRAYYMEGEFKKAASHFQLALEVNPQDAETHYWIGMSYQLLADIAAPFDGKHRSKARAYLTRATELAPERRDYRMALFDFLLDSASSSRATLRQAAVILRNTPESDWDYSSMRRRLEQETKIRASGEARLGWLFLAVPRAAYAVAELPGSILSSSSEREHRALVEQ